MADNQSVPMPPHIKAELARLRALMVPDAEAYRRREIGSKRMEEEAKKFPPFRPLGVADIDLEYPSAAKGGEIHMDKGGVFKEHVMPFVNRGLDSMFPLRQMMQRAYIKDLWDPVNNAMAQDIPAAVRNMNVARQDANSAKYHMENSARKAVGIEPLPERYYDPAKALGQINVNEFPNPDNPIKPKSARLWDDIFLNGDYKKASGGQVDMDRMRLELMNGKKKFLEPSVEKGVMYHGTRGNIKNFKPSKVQAYGGPDAVYVSSIPNVANKFAERKQADSTFGDPLGVGEKMPKGANVMPLHVQVTNPFDVENPEHYEALVNHLNANPPKVKGEFAPHANMDWFKKQQLEMALLNASNSHKRAKEKRTNYQFLENPDIQDAIKKMGHDAFYTHELGAKNLGIYDPKKIKSAIGNRGTYDINDPDITKAKGGSVMGVNVASDKKASMHYADLIVDGHKTLESRNTDSLRPYVGKRVAIVRTGAGKAKAIGEVTIGEPIVANKKKFHAMREHHLVPEGSQFDIKTDTKHLYPMHDPERYEEERDVGHGILSRKVIHKDKGGKIEVRPTVFDDAASRRNPKIEAAARALMEGEMTKKAYEKVVAKEKPVKRYDFIPKPATDEQAMNVLIDRQKQNWRSHENWPAGHRVGLRLDIPSYERHGVWVNSIHDESGGEDKFPTSYGSVSSVRNATFEGSPNKAIRVATGEQNKTPFARIKGELEHIDEKKAIAHMKKYLNHPDYRQVGYDPRRHGDFYDRETMEPVTHSEHVVQIGPLVLAKKPKYGKREVYAKGGATHAHHLQIEERPL